MIRLPNTVPIPAPDPATPTVAAPAPMNLAAVSMSRLTALVWKPRTATCCWGATRLCGAQSEAAWKRNKPRQSEAVAQVSKLHCEERRKTSKQASLFETPPCLSQVNCLHLLSWHQRRQRQKVACTEPEIQHEPVPTKKESR